MKFFKKVSFPVFVFCKNKFISILFQEIILSFVIFVFLVSK